jgi:hypothetical protein
MVPAFYLVADRLVGSTGRIWGRRPRAVEAPVSPAQGG